MDIPAGSVSDKTRNSMSPSDLWFLGERTDVSKAPGIRANTSQPLTWTTMTAAADQVIPGLSGATLDRHLWKHLLTLSTLVQ